MCALKIFSFVKNHGWQKLPSRRAAAQHCGHLFDSIGCKAVDILRAPSSKHQSTNWIWGHTDFIEVPNSTSIHWTIDAAFLVHGQQHQLEKGFQVRFWVRTSAPRKAKSGCLWQNALIQSFPGRLSLKTVWRLIESKNSLTIFFTSILSIGWLAS